MLYVCMYLFNYLFIYSFINEREANFMTCFIYSLTRQKEKHYKNCVPRLKNTIVANYSAIFEQEQANILGLWEYQTWLSPAETAFRNFKAMVLN